MSNDNCLSGMSCPRCGSEGPFNIHCSAWMEVYDDGVSDHGDVEWSENSLCQCRDCNFIGGVKDFSAKEEEPDPLVKVTFKGSIVMPASMLDRAQTEIYEELFELLNKSDWSTFNLALDVDNVDEVGYPLRWEDVPSHFREDYEKEEDE